MKISQKKCRNRLARPNGLERTEQKVSFSVCLESLEFQEKSNCDNLALFSYEKRRLKHPGFLD